MLNTYRVSLSWVLHHRPVMLAMFLAVLGITGYLYVVVPKGFIPDTDNDTFNIQTEATQGTSYYQMVNYMSRLSKIVAQDPDIDTFYSDRRRFRRRGQYRPHERQPETAPAARGHRFR
jgi:multidrug efflux pump subunit AcrB